MPMNVLWFCGIFGFPEQLFHPWHTASLLGLFYAITYKDMKAPFPVERGILPDSGIPVSADIPQRPGGCPEKVEHGIITARVKCKVTDNGSNTKFIGTEHKSNGDGYKPVECRSA